MKSQFARIKNRASSVSTRALAVMLCFVMLLTAVGAGTMMTAIAAGGVTTPVADAAQKVIDIADSVDVSAAEVAEDKAPTETVFDKLKKLSSELSVPSRHKKELVAVGSNYRTDYNYVAVNAWNYPAAYSELSKNSDGFVLTKSGQHFYGTIYYNNSNGDSAFYNTYFNFYVGVDENNKSNFYMKPGSSTTFWESNSTGMTSIYENGGGGDFTIQLKKAASKYVKVDFDFYGEWDFGGDNNKFTAAKAYQTVVDSLSTSYSSSTASSYVGSEVNIVPNTHTGGSGKYSYSYTVKTTGGATVSSSKYTITDGKFVAKEPGTYVVKATMSDSVITGIATASTGNKTITVTYPDYYIGHSGNTWGDAGTSSDKFTNNGDGTFSLQYSFTDGFEFIVKSSGGTSYRMSSSSAYWINNSDIGGSAITMSTTHTSNLKFKASDYYSIPVLITFNPATPSIKFDQGIDYYLTGYINNTAVTTKLAAYGFTKTGTNTYSLTLSPTAGTAQYVTITRGSDSKTFHPTSLNAGSGVAAGSTPDSNPNNDNKWKVAAGAGKTINFTYNSSTLVLSWTIISAMEDENDYRVFWSTSDNGIVKSTPDNTLGGSSDTNGVKKSGNRYYYNLSSWLAGKTAGTNYYFAISNTTGYAGIFGLGSGDNASPKATNVTTADNQNCISSASVQEYGNTISSTYYKGKFARLSFSAVPSYLYMYADYNATTANTVTYHFITSSTAIAEGGAEDETPTVTIYAKDGCAPINWDNNSSSSHTNPKSGPGATSLSGFTFNDKLQYLYNYAAIATTTICKSDGTHYTSGEGLTSADCDINGGTSGSAYEKITLDAGTTIQIKTQIANTTGKNWRTRYYVKGWCINGKTYYGSGLGVNKTGTTGITDGLYTLTYTLPDNVSTLEITPIYYPVDESNCLTFYLEGYDAELQNSGWGHTPYAFPFYGELYGYQDSFGVYPGQPFIWEDGKYYIEIPLSSTAIDPARNAKDGTKVKGITVSNGYADYVHKNLIYNWSDANEDAAHRQTYDYDDFYKIYNEKTDSQGNKPNAIIVRMKNRSKTNNRDTYGGDDSNYAWGYTHAAQPSTTLSRTEVGTIATKNGWELLTDYHGRPVDIFGNLIGTTYSAATEQSKTALRVISSGYNENIAGDYGTAWQIYRPSNTTASNYNTALTNTGEAKGSAGYYSTSYDYSLITGGTKYAIPPSVLMLKNTTSFNTTTYPNASRSVDGQSYTDSINNYSSLYTALDTYKGRYVYVSYEKNAQKIYSGPTSKGANRADARWYYTFATDMVQSKIKIQYWDSTQNKYVDEASYIAGDNSAINKGNHTKCMAYFTNSAFEYQMASGDVLINSTDYVMKAVNASGWKFDSWNIEYDGGTSYSEDVSHGSKTYNVKASGSDVFVARFTPVAAGDLDITHTLSADSTGSGTAKVQVKIYTDNTKTQLDYDSGLVEGGLTLEDDYITNTKGNYYIEVYLQTDRSGDDTCVTDYGNSTYGIDYSDDYDSADLYTSATGKSHTGSSAQITFTYGFTVSQLFSGDTQLYKSLSHTSKITRTDHHYDITYNYTDRTGAAKSYTARGTFTSSEYSNTEYVSGLGETVTNTFIALKAPFESNFNSILTLSGQTATQSYNDSTKTHTISITYAGNPRANLTATFELPYEYYTTGDNAPIAGTKKYTAKKNGSGLVEKATSATFEISTGYQKFFTIDGTQNKVSPDYEDTENHSNNGFVTAPKIIMDGSTPKYFSYWQIMTADHLTEIAKVYFIDFHYIAYGNYYVTPIYGDIDHAAKEEMENSGLSASAVYLGDSRSQYNTPASNTTADHTKAADIIYNEFALAYGYNGQEVKKLGDNVEIGMFIERIAGSDTGADKSISDMNYYKTLYADSVATSKAQLETYLTDGTHPTIAALRQVWNKSDLNNKNRMEKYYSFFSRYGQTIGTHSFAYSNDVNYDDYVYRAYAYIKDTNTREFKLSEPTYFCMKYTANRIYG